MSKRPRPGSRSFVRDDRDGHGDRDDYHDHDDRAQLILVAAAVVAVALAPLVLAYLQLGYHADVQAAAEYDDPAANAKRVLGRAVHEASVGIRGEYGPAAGNEAVAAVRLNLRPRLRTLEASRVAEGIAYTVAYNQTAAAAWMRPANCPGGPNRQFGPCVANRGVVVQERAGELHLVAVAFDVRVLTPRGETRLTVVVRAVD